MLKELLAYIIDIGKKTAEPRTKQIENELFVFNDDGLIEERVTLFKPEPAIERTCLTVSDMTDAIESFQLIAKRRGVELYGLGNRTTATTVVAIVASGATVTLDAETANDSVVLRFTENPAFAKLSNMDREFEQKELIKFLRTDLYGVADSMVGTFRDLVWNRSESGGGKVGHGDESLGRSIEQKVATGTDIPEMFTVTIPVLSNPGPLGMIKVDIPIVITLEMQSERVRLTIPKPAIEKAMAYFAVEVRQLISEGVVEKQLENVLILNS